MQSTGCLEKKGGQESKLSMEVFDIAETSLSFGRFPSCCVVGVVCKPRPVIILESLIANQQLKSFHSSVARDLSQTLMLKSDLNIIHVSAKFLAQVLKSYSPNSQTLQQKEK